jgi:hypothetical protein
MLGSGDSRTKLVYYACKDPDCNSRVSVTARVVDELVTAYVLAYLGNQQVTPEMKPWPRAAELATAEAKAAELLDAYDRGDLSGDLAFPRIKNKKAEIAELKRERTAYFRAQSKASATTDVAARWPKLELEQKREIIGECIEANAVANDQVARAQGNHNDVSDVVNSTVAYSPHIMHNRVQVTGDLKVCKTSKTKTAWKIAQSVSAVASARLVSTSPPKQSGYFAPLCPFRASTNTSTASSNR